MSRDVSDSLIETYERLYPSKTKGDGPSIADLFDDRFVDEPAPDPVPPLIIPQIGVQSVNVPISVTNPIYSGTAQPTWGSSGGGGGYGVYAPAPVVALDENSVKVQQSYGTSWPNGQQTVTLREYTEQQVINEMQTLKIKCADGLTRTMNDWFTYKLREQLRYYVKPEAINHP